MFAFFTETFLSSCFSPYVQSSSWPKTKTVMKKWLNLKNSEFHSDCIGKSG